MRIINISSGYSIAIYIYICINIIKWNVMTAVMIVHSTCGSRMYIGMYIPDCMISDNNCF